MAKQDGLVTKKELKEELSALEHRMDGKFEQMKDWMRDLLDETFLKYRDELMTNMDKWAGYAKKDYEETEIISHKVISHEERIDKLEKAVFTN